MLYRRRCRPIEAESAQERPVLESDCLPQTFVKLPTLAPPRSNGFKYLKMRDRYSCLQSEIRYRCYAQAPTSVASFISGYAKYPWFAQPGPDFLC
jgi:hypothetical protein